MSCRQPASTTAARTTSSAREKALGRNVGYSYRVQALEECPGLVRVEPRIGGFDAQEEPVARGTVERGHVEHRVVRLRQLVERPHADEAAEGGAKHRGLERDRDELRPAVERTGPDVHRIRDG